MNASKNTNILLSSTLFAIPCIVIIGWIFNIEIFKEFSAGFAAMNPVTALTFILASVALLLIHRVKKDVHNIINLLAVSVITIGLARIASYLNIYDFKVDHWLFPQKTASAISGLKCRMAPNTAIGFVVSGTGILLLNLKRHKAFLADYAALFIAFIGLLSLTGYVYHAREFYEMKMFHPMALPTAVCFILLSLGIFSYKKESGFSKEITSRNGGGKIAALLIPVAIIIPFVLGYWRVQSDRAGNFSSSFSTAMVSIAGTTVSVFFIWMISASINRLNFSLLKEIEARKEVEYELKGKNFFLDTILDHTPANFFVKDAKELKYVSINRATGKFLNLKKEAVIGKTDYEIFSKGEADAIRKIDLQVLNEGKQVFTEQKVQRDNVDRWLSTKKIPVKDAHGNPLYIIGIAQDITEQKRRQDQINQFNKELEKKVLERTEELSKSERRFRSLIENGVDIIKMMSEDGLIFFASRSHKRVLGFCPDELMNTNWLRYVHPDERKNGVALIQKAIANPLVPVHGSFRLLHKQGHYNVSVEGTITNFLHDESVKALVCNFHDITERLRIENEKQLLEKALTAEKINRQKQITQATIDGQEKERTTIAMELHDNINQMLGMIKLYIEMAIKVPATTKEMLAKSYENVVVCINEIKKLSTKLVIPNLDGGLSNAIADLIESFEKGGHITITYYESDEILQKMNAVKQLAFYRIVQELLTNVIKHAEAKNVCISFDEIDGWIALSLKDDGKGFNTYKINKGLGLQNIQNRVEVLNGTFEITSAENEGCAVTVSIPEN